MVTSKAETEFLYDDKSNGFYRSDDKFLKIINFL